MLMDEESPLSKKEQVYRRRLMVKKFIWDGIAVKDVAKMMNRPYSIIYQDARLVTDWQSTRDDVLEDRKLERQEKIVELFKGDHTLAEIAEMLQVSQSTIKLDMEELGLSFQERLEVYQEYRLQQFEELHRMGKTTQEIAKEMGVSRPTVLAYGKELGYEPNQRIIDKKESRTKTIKCLYDEGVSAKEIADMLDISTATVYRNIKK